MIYVLWEGALCRILPLAAGWSLHGKIMAGDWTRLPVGICFGWHLAMLVPRVRRNQHLAIVHSQFPKEMKDAQMNPSVTRIVPGGSHRPWTGGSPPTCFYIKPRSRPSPPLCVGGRWATTWPSQWVHPLSAFGDICGRSQCAAFFGLQTMLFSEFC